MRLVDLRVEDAHSRRGRVADFNDFLQDVVAKHVHTETESTNDTADDVGAEGTIPLTAIPVREIAMLYPVAHIARLVKSAQRLTRGNGAVAASEVPMFLDFNNKSIVLKVLRTRLW